MKAVDTIRRAGFRKWYERELLQSHLHLVLLLLSSVGILGAVEAFGQRAPGASPLTMFGCAVVSAVVGAWALRRYLFLLSHAEYLADQAVCGQCHAYAKWDVTEEVPQAAQLRVC